jgi:trk system potassium uptake protein
MRLIMIGGNKTVYYLARKFINRKYHVTIINRDVVRAKELAQTKATVVIGEGTNVGRLEEAGARQADVFLALTSHDQDNLIACQIAQRKFGVPRTIAVVNDPDNEPIFQRLGITIAFSATRIIGSIIDQETDFEDITALMPLAKGRINVTDVRLDADSPAIGKSLQELPLTDNSLVACIIRDDEVIVPRGATRLQFDDHLILISQPEHQKHDLALLCGHPPK